MLFTYRFTILYCLWAMTMASCGEGYTPKMVRQPYLQSAIADSVSVLWRTDVGNGCEVRYRTVGASRWLTAKGVVRVANTGLIANEVTLTGLDHAQVYEYQVLTDGIEPAPSKMYRFRAPLSRADTAFTFFAVGDVGEPVADDGTPDVLGKALALQKDQFHFGLFLGDIIYPDGQSEDYDKNLFPYFTEVFPYVPVFTVLGNHDWHEPQQNYMQEWKLPNNEHYYSFTYGNACFIALDSKNGEMHEYDTQREWLIRELENAREGGTDWLIVFLHHNGKSCTYKEDYEAVVSLYPLFEKYRVDLVLNGHAHTYERLNPMDGGGQLVPGGLDEAGFTSITIGSGGKLRGIGTDPGPFTPDPDNCRYPGLVAKSVHDWAYAKFHINGKKLVGQAITTKEHEVVDTFELVK